MADATRAEADTISPQESREQQPGKFVAMRTPGLEYSRYLLGSHQVSL
jgi:hypothetical protein